MSRRATRVMTLVTATGLLCSGAALAQEDDDDGFEFEGRLSGAQEPVPPDEPATPSPGIETAASGNIVVVFAPDLSSFNFQLTVRNATGVTASHLHCAPPGVNGPIVVFLSEPSEEGQDVNGVLAEGTRTNANIEEGAAECEELIGRPIRNIASLAAAAAAGLVYANVHTTANPAGEIRGQLILDGDDDLNGMPGQPPPAGSIGY